MFKSQHNFFNYCPNHGGIIPPESIRFIPETFGDPERSFAYLALVSFLWPPSGAPWTSRAKLSSLEAATSAVGWPDRTSRANEGPVRAQKSEDGAASAAIWE